MNLLFQLLLYFVGLVRVIKGNCLDKICFYNYPVVNTDSDKYNNNNNNNNNNNIYTYTFITSDIIL